MIVLTVKNENDPLFTPQSLYLLTIRMAEDGQMMVPGQMLVNVVTILYSNI